MRQFLTGTLRCRRYAYWLGGQLASATVDGRTEEFLWDGLALVRRGATGYLCEPHANGGSPILDSDGGVLFNDLLGSTLGALGGDGYKPLSLTAFGDTEDAGAFFTGKPQVEGLGYAFLLRNYRPDHGKWLTADPLGYPDGWNQMAYCGNISTHILDATGGQWGNSDFIAYYYRTFGPDDLDTDWMGLTSAIWGHIVNSLGILNNVKAQINSLVRSYLANGSCDAFQYNTNNSYSFGDVCFALGDGVVRTYSSVFILSNTGYLGDHLYRFYYWEATVTVQYTDTFVDPLDIGLELGNAYSYGHVWNNVSLDGDGAILLE